MMGGRDLMEVGVASNRIPVEVRAHPRSRRLKLSYRQGRGFLLTHPRRASHRSVSQFLEQQRDWMLGVLARENPRQGLISLRSHLESQPGIWLDGHYHEVRFEAAVTGLLRVQGGRICLFSLITEDQLRRKLMALSKEPLESMLLRLAAEVGWEQSVRRVQVRDQRSRWGSCSGQGNLSLNWRLILMPPALQRHVMLHELAHLPHPDHSAAFWRCLEVWDPLCAEHREQLRTKGSHWITLGRSGG
jgi:predicted metal-dependent hydrolase